MKNIFLSLILALVLSFPLFAETTSATLNVKGMFCSGCSSKVEKTLNKLPGVESSSVNYENGTAQVQYDSSKVSPEKIADKVTDIGFETTVSR